MASLPPSPPDPDPFAEPESFDPDPDEPAPVELGAAVGDLPPFGTVLVLLACAIVFAAQAVRGEVGDSAALVAWGASIGNAYGLEAAWRTLASTLVHGGGYHLLLNSISLLMYGSAVEAIFARSSFWLIYVFGGIGASTGSLLWRTTRGTGAGISVGASGAIFALAGSLIFAAIRLRGRLPVGRWRAIIGATLFLVVQALASGLAEYRTDNAAHASGLIAGIVLGAFVPLNERLSGPPADPEAEARRRRWAVVGMLAALMLATAFVASMVRGLARP